MTLPRVRRSEQRVLTCACPRLSMMILASLAISTSSALAQGVPTVSPPVVQGSTNVTYPAGAMGDAAVVLELIVEADGTVSNVTVIEGAEPFAEHAKRAVLGWQFVPARRGTQPVAARIRARVEFHQEPTPSPPAAAGPPTAVGAGAPAPVPPGQTPAPAPAAEAPLNVTVRG